MSYQKLENTNIGLLYAKVANNLFDRTHCDDFDFKMYKVHIVTGTASVAEAVLMPCCVVPRCEWQDVDRKCK